MIGFEFACLKWERYIDAWDAIALIMTYQVESMIINQKNFTYQLHTYTASGHYEIVKQ